MRKGTSHTVSIQMFYLILVSDYEDGSHLSEQCLLHGRNSIDICLVDDRGLSNSYPGHWHCRHCPFLGGKTGIYTQTHMCTHISFA